MSEIKVGSEWVDALSNEFVTVKYVGEHKVFIKWDNDGFEAERSQETFLKNFKPAPVRRTVWLNVYPDMVVAHNTKDRADRCKDNHVLWQQEVELIDPSEGGKARCS